LSAKLQPEGIHEIGSRKKYCQIELKANKEADKMSVYFQLTILSKKSLFDGITARVVLMEE
jgi:hypothetical protein